MWWYTSSDLQSLFLTTAYHLMFFWLELVLCSHGCGLVFSNFRVVCPTYSSHYDVLALAWLLLLNIFISVYNLQARYISQYNWLWHTAIFPCNDVYITWHIYTDIWYSIRCKANLQCARGVISFLVYKPILYTRNGITHLKLWQM
jgi:hypothetical protein